MSGGMDSDYSVRGTRYGGGGPGREYSVSWMER